MLAAAMGLALATVGQAASRDQGQAQNPFVQNDDKAAVERSRAIQAELARIERNKEGFFNELMASWASFLDHSLYDSWSELKTIALDAPAWQLYGASLVGDFYTMVNVMRGRIGAGQFVNALGQPQPKRFTSNILGDETNSLVFTPIAPCRIADTRNAGARTGILNPGVVRDFDFTTGAFAKGQGGDLACPGLPAFSHFGWSANITVTGYANIGGLKAWGFGGTEPSASIINYFPAGFAIANGTTLTGCFGCFDDVKLMAFGNATHVIIDIVGYFEQALTSGPAITRFAGATTSVAPNTRQFVDGGACPAGTLLVGGEVDHYGIDMSVGESRQASSTAWTMWIINRDGVARDATVFSRCMDAPKR
jgi:hypothetical protein